MRWLYSTLTWAAQPLLRRKLRRRAVAEPGYAVAVAREQVGLTDREVVAANLVAKAPSVLQFFVFSFIREF